MRDSLEPSTCSRAQAPSRCFPGCPRCYCMCQLTCSCGVGTIPV